MDSDIQSESKTAHSAAHWPTNLAVFILPQEAKAVVILHFVRQDWLKWSCDKDDI